MAQATYFVQPMRYSGDYLNGYWAGYRFREKLGYTTGYHVGVDYNLGGGNDDLGERVNTIANGVVDYVNNNITGGFGKIIVIKHILNARLAKKYGVSFLYSRYFHMNTINVKAGQTVSVGSKIGTCGNTGTTYAHLHCAISKATGKGYFNYPSNDIATLNKYYDTWKFIEENNKDAEQMDALKKENAKLKADKLKLTAQVKTLDKTLDSTRAVVRDLEIEQADTLEALENCSENRLELEAKLAECTKALEVEKGNLDEMRSEYNTIEAELADCKGKPTMPDDKSSDPGSAIMGLLAWLKNLIGRK